MANNAKKPNHRDIVARSKSILQILEQLKTLALSDCTVLFIGETGVGKEVLAEYLHQKSVRRFKPLVKVGVSTLPKDLVESELFGHERGSYTSAVSEKRGLFEVADQGTLLLDDIDDLPIEIQPKLLRAMESGEIQRIGGTRVIPVDVRFVAATKVNLKELVDQGKFRADLFYRIHVVPIQIPPLRERREDIPELIEYFLRSLVPERDLRISEQAIEVLVNYPWPGNVRELKNTLNRILLFADEEITVDHIADEIRQHDPLDELMTGCVRCCMEKEMSFQDVVGCLEINLLRKSLELHSGNKSRAARSLNLKLSTFRDKLAKYDLTDFRQ